MSLKLTFLFFFSHNYCILSGRAGLCCQISVDSHNKKHTFCSNYVKNMVQQIQSETQSSQQWGRNAAKPNHAQVLTLYRDVKHLI